MADRLQELLTQRHLIEEHLAWIDRQIGEERGGRPETAQRTVPLALRPAASAVAPLDPAPSSQADDILSKYQQAPGSIGNDARKGCLILFFTGMAVLLGTVGTAYYFYAQHLAEQRSPANLSPGRPAKP